MPCDKGIKILKITFVIGEDHVLDGPIYCAEVNAIDCFLFEVPLHVR